MGIFERISLSCIIFLFYHKLLPIKTVIAFPQMFLFDEFMEYFIRNGGVIEAHPQYKE